MCHASGECVLQLLLLLLLLILLLLLLLLLLQLLQLAAAGTTTSVAGYTSVELNVDENLFQLASSNARTKHRQNSLYASLLITALPRTLRSLARRSAAAHPLATLRDRFAPSSTCPTTNLTPALKVLISHMMMYV